MGPRFLRDAACDATKDPKIARLQAIPKLHRKFLTQGSYT